MLGSGDKEVVSLCVFLLAHLCFYSESAKAAHLSGGSIPNPKPPTNPGVLASNAVAQGTESADFGSIPGSIMIA